MRPKDQAKYSMMIDQCNYIRAHWGHYLQPIAACTQENTRLLWIIFVWDWKLLVSFFTITQGDIWICVLALRLQMSWGMAGRITITQHCVRQPSPEFAHSSHQGHACHLTLQMSQRTSNSPMPGHTSFPARSYSTQYGCNIVLHKTDTICLLLFRNGYEWPWCYCLPDRYIICIISGNRSSCWILVNVTYSIESLEFITYHINCN